MKFVILGLLIVLFIGFCVAVWKAAQNWRWYHITAAVITMILSIVFLFPTANVLKSRQAWHKIKEELEERLEKAEQETHLIRYGDLSDPTAAVGLSDLTLELSKIGIEAGRRWRNLRMRSGDANTVSLTKPVLQQPVDPALAAAADPAAPAAADPAAGPMVPVGLIVYGFAEGPFPNVDRPIPVKYLGEFKVTASDPNSVTLTPTSALEQTQVAAITGGQAVSWSLYEMLPLDGHDPFIVDASKPTDDNILGRVDEALVNALLRNARPDTLQAYLNDGKKGKSSKTENNWVKIEFIKKHQIDVDSPEQRGALDGGFFDNNGRSVDSRLQRDDDGMVRFAVGDILVVSEETAKQLVDVEGVARLLDNYYLRRLNDYRFVLRRLRVRISELAIRRQELEYEQEVLQAADNANGKMLELGQTEKVMLEQDLTQTRVEAKAIGDYHDALVEDLRQARETLTRLYKSNIMLEQQLDQLNGTVAR
ncbi:hypothetical protein [Stieleria varia]|uniref:Uncharacterized protein n=1 Tax=Stieleria varia TaxID=2528005 RepID=A0A5C6B9N6_9BACT|nr:hypothetical protein [Stieleria varia]TWU08352.1 hypothetical protein Pla52n_09340 [Stieleria varia]